MDYSKLFLTGGRYELITSQETLTVWDHEPWRRCWSCENTDNQPDESFCAHCGAALEKRRYRVLRVPADETGLPLIATDETVLRCLFPTMWDSVEHDGQWLLLLDETRSFPLVLPVDEIDALKIGMDLVSILDTLHQYGSALGSLSPDDIRTDTAGHAHLFTIPAICRIPDNPADQAHAVATDLYELAELLEAITVTPRTTQRLPDAVAATTPELPSDELSFADLLRQMRTGEILDVSTLYTRFETLLRDQTHPLPLLQQAASLTDTGIIRDHNEDGVFCLTMTLQSTTTHHTWGLYIVADGMGGHAAGEIASTLAIRGAADTILREYFAQTLTIDTDYDNKWTRDIVHRAVRNANETVRTEGHTCGNDMGTTLTLALVIGNRATIANVGDSRTYLYRDGVLRRISRDHSLVMRLVELGQIAENDIYTHPQRNAILRSLGDQANVEVDLFEERLYPGDILLLCSDGQWEMTHNAEMEAILTKHLHDPYAACDELIRAANQAGGEDNISAIVVRLC